MKAADSDNSGGIDYTEFVKSCIDWKVQMNDNNLRQAFNTFD